MTATGWLVAGAIAAAAIVAVLVLAYFAGKDDWEERER